MILTKDEKKDAACLSEIKIPFPVIIPKEISLWKSLWFHRVKLGPKETSCVKDHFSISHGIIDRRVIVLKILRVEPPLDFISATIQTHISYVFSQGQ
jgi:hypothetical protein